jgi:hypothetical protein
MLYVNLTSIIRGRRSCRQLIPKVPSVTGNIRLGGGREFRKAAELRERLTEGVRRVHLRIIIRNKVPGVFDYSIAAVRYVTSLPESPERRRAKPAAYGIQETIKVSRLSDEDN